MADPDLDAIRRRLAEAGAQPWELEAARSLEDLIVLSGDLGVRPSGDRTSLRAVAAAAAVPLADVVTYFRAAGIAVGDPDATDWYTSDVEWIRATHAAAAIFGDGATLSLLRRAGSAMSQLSTAASSVFRVNMADTGALADPMSAVERNLGARPLVALLLEVVGQLYRYHARYSFREDGTAAGTYSEVRRMSVGFVDLASSTELGAALFGPDLARAVGEFNTVAHDVATRQGTRVVKTIGDEVMVCSLDAAAVCRTALDLVAFCARHETFSSARGAVATGDVLEQEGDCYGPVVNRAARFAANAPDGVVVVDAETVDAVGDALVVAPLPPVVHRGIGTVPWSTVGVGPGSPITP